MKLPLIDNLIIRRSKKSDLDQLLSLSKLTGSGMTTMPTDRQLWIDKLNRSEADFESDNPRIDGDVYFLVLEDLETGELVGSGAFYAGIGLSQPFYSYKVTTITTTSETLQQTFHNRVLNLVNDYSGATEIGSLFLKPQYRRDGIGKFLSRARFLLLADFPERFTKTIFAEMRGWIDENDRSPFWEHLGRRFFGLSFKKADFISAVDGSQFISDLMPKFPVYIDLLPEEAQHVIGKPHDSTTGALKILEREGFKFHNYVDVFDAGPSVDVNIKEIKTVRDSRKRKVIKLLEQAEFDQQYILSNCQLKNYKMMRAPLGFNDDGDILITHKNAQSLDIKAGDMVRIVEA